MTLRRSARQRRSLARESWKVFPRHLCLHGRPETHSDLWSVETEHHPLNSTLVSPPMSDLLKEARSLPLVRKTSRASLLDCHSHKLGSAGSSSWHIDVTVYPPKRNAEPHFLIPNCPKTVIHPCWYKSAHRPPANQRIMALPMASSLVSTGLSLMETN